MVGRAPVSDIEAAKSQLNVPTLCTFRVLKKVANYTLSVRGPYAILDPSNESCPFQGSSNLGGFGVLTPSDWEAPTLICPQAASVGATVDGDCPFMNLGVFARSELQSYCRWSTSDIVSCDGVCVH